mgnify:FL=1
MLLDRFDADGFVGIPLCSAVFDTEGTVLGSLSVPCATIYMFLFVMQSFRRDKEQNLGQQLKSLMTPLNISTLAMLIMLATGWKFSGAPLQFLSSMANCVVPTSMLIIGCLLAGSPLIDVLKKPILYLITFLRCLVMPLIAAVILRFTGWDRTVCLCIVMVLGCSVATQASPCWTRRRTRFFSAAPATVCTGTAASFSSSSATAASRASRA